MPFCRKCGRRLPKYSESCPECGTSTTAPLIKIRRTSAVRMEKAIAPFKVAETFITSGASISFKAIAPLEPVKAVVRAKVAAPSKAVTAPKLILPTKTFVAPEDSSPHEIKKTNLSIQKDILANPKDYETQTFNFGLKCTNDHLWPAGRALPVSNRQAFCPQCGEPLRNTKRNKQRRYHTF